MTDQQRADFTRSEGFALDTMPALDAFSTRGYRFRRAYTSSPLCTPARCSLFTGRYPKATGVRDNYQSGAHIRRSSADLFDVLKEMGYHESTCLDEVHAYFRDGGSEFEDAGVDMKPYRSAVVEVQKIYASFKKKAQRALERRAA